MSGLAQGDIAIHKDGRTGFMNYVEALGVWTLRTHPPSNLETLACKGDSLPPGWSSAVVLPAPPNGGVKWMLVPGDLEAFVRGWARMGDEDPGNVSMLAEFVALNPESETP